MEHLHGRIGVKVHSRIALSNQLQDFTVVLQYHLWVQPALKANLSGSYPLSLLHTAQDRLDRELIANVLPEGTEGAAPNAAVGEVYIPVDDERYFIAAAFLSHEICQAKEPDRLTPKLQKLVVIDYTRMRKRRRIGIMIRIG
jgi:hypothetical protein